MLKSEIASSEFPVETRSENGDRAAIAVKGGIGDELADQTGGAGAGPS